MKVYCKNCKHHAPLSKETDCYIIKSKPKRKYYEIDEPNFIFLEPEVENKDGECRNYEATLWKKLVHKISNKRG